MKKTFCLLIIMLLLFLPILNSYAYTQDELLNEYFGAWYANNTDTNTTIILLIGLTSSYSSIPHAKMFYLDNNNKSINYIVIPDSNTIFEYDVIFDTHTDRVYLVESESSDTLCLYFSENDSKHYIYSLKYDDEPVQITKITY